MVEYSRTDHPLGIGRHRKRRTIDDSGRIAKREDASVQQPMMTHPVSTGSPWTGQRSGPQDSNTGRVRVAADTRRQAATGQRVTTIKAIEQGVNLDSGQQN